VLPRFVRANLTVLAVLVWPGCGHSSNLVVDSSLRDTLSDLDAGGLATAPGFMGLNTNDQGAAHAWPPLTPFGGYRIWNDISGLLDMWAGIEPSANTYVWTTLDAYVARGQQAGADILYTFGDTPSWAALNLTCPVGYQPGQCSPP